MKRENIRNWFQESVAMIGVVGQVLQQVNQLKAHRNLAEAAGHGNNLMEAEKKLNELGKAYDSMAASLFQRLFVTDFDSAQQHLVDLESKLEIMDKAFGAWREKKAEFDYIIATVGFASPEQRAAGDPRRTRAEAENELTELKGHFETALKLCDDLVPNRPVLLHV